MARALRLVAAAGIALACAGANVLRAAGDRALGEYLSSECVTCHRIGAQSQSIPAIAGLPPATFVRLLNEYRLKRRANPIMQTIAARLSDDEMAALAEYFGAWRRSGDDACA